MEFGKGSFNRGLVIEAFFIEGGGLEVFWLLLSLLLEEFDSRINSKRINKTCIYLVKLKVRKRVVLVHSVNFCENAELEYAH